MADDDRDIKDHAYWKNVAKILNVQLIGWTYKTSATFNDGSQLNQNVADVLTKQNAEIEWLKQENERLQSNLVMMDTALSQALICTDKLRKRLMTEND